MSDMAVADTVIQSADLGGSAPAHSMSMLSLFLDADIIVKLVMLLLAFMSVWCWAIIMQKRTRVSSLARRAVKFEEAFWSGDPLDKLYDRVAKQAKNDPMLKVFTTGMDEWRTESKNSKNAAAALDRIEGSMRATMRREIVNLKSGLLVLSMTASYSAFIGLFGTVWGIMRSFTAIAAMQNTSLAVVAPGIAEALYATGVGLIAAITGIFGYNLLSGAIGRYATALDIFIDEFKVILSRYLER